MGKVITTRYQLELGIESSLRVALVADLHDRPCEEVLAILQQEQPDLICVAGDLMERHDLGAVMADGTISPWTLSSMEAWMETKPFYAVITRFLKALDGSLPGKAGKDTKRRKKWDEANGRHFLRRACRIAPVYYSLGNHEWYHTPEDAALFAECGITVLDNRDVEVTAGRNDFRLGGLSTRFDRDWLKAYAAKPGIKLLLMHHPTYYERLVEEVDDFALILCGHVHGGQWRLFGRGIFAPGQGLLPHYHHGRYPTRHSRESGQGGLILSAGCANTAGIPRFGNPCEVVILELNGN